MVIPTRTRHITGAEQSSQNSNSTRTTLQELARRSLSNAIIKEALELSIGQIVLIAFTFQLNASLFQPAVGHCTDRRPQTFSLVAGMGFPWSASSFSGLPENYTMLLLGAAPVGTGSTIFHPDATRVPRIASFSRSLFSRQHGNGKTCTCSALFYTSSSRRTHWIMLD